MGILIVLAACTHKPFPLVVQPAPPAVATCDTQQVFYASVIKPILKSNCYSCHGASVTANGGLDLETFTSLKDYLQLGFRGDGLYGSKLYHCLLHSQNAQPMPPTYIVDSCSLKLIKRWIDLGGQNN
jgi:hypothetical protein